MYVWCENMFTSGILLKTKAVTSKEDILNMTTLIAYNFIIVIIEKL